MSLEVLTRGGGSSGPAASIFVTGLSETDTVSASKDGKTVQGKWTESANPEYIGLPNGYTQLEYIESSGTQYINTNWSPPANSGFEVEYSQSSIYSTSNNQLFGFLAVSGTSTIKRFYLTLPSSNDSSVRFGVNSTQLTLATSASLNEKYEISYHGTVIDSPWGSFGAEKLATSVGKVYVFAADVNRGSEGVEQYSAARIYKLRFYEGDTVVRNFIPAKRNSDGVLGLYDLANNVFYTNNGTGSFTAGAEITTTIGGHLISPIKELGTWTVTATDGEETATQDVLVDVITEYEIEIDLYKLWLYRDGEEYDSIGGGLKDYYQSANCATITRGTDSVTITTKSQSNGAGGFRSNESIDLTPYAKLCVELLNYTDTYGQYPFHIGFWSTTANDYAVTVDFAASAMTVFPFVAEVDLSGVSASGILCIDVPWRGQSATISKIWFE